MPRYKKKTLSYRRAMWWEDSGVNLEQLLRSAQSIKTSIGDRTFQRELGQSIEGLVLAPVKSGGVLIHLAAQTPGDTASVLSASHASSTTGTVGTTNPPPGSEFMDGDIFAYCRNDDVCTCGSGLRDETLAWFMRSLFAACKLGGASTRFELQRVADTDKLKLINAEGVKEIELGASLYEATATYETRTHGMGQAVGAAARYINAAFGSDRAPKPDNLKVSVIIKADGRMKEGSHLGFNKIEDMARELIGIDDDYVITTRKNQKITASSVTVRKFVEIEAHGKSVNSNSAWQALARFYHELTASGATQK